jgi:hypothetical protein
MTDITVHDEIPWAPEATTIARQMQLLPDDREGAAQVAKLIALAADLGRPKALYADCPVDPAGDDAVEICGVRFVSKLLCRNLDKVGRVFPYVATCGRELEEATLLDDDFMTPYIWDAIKADALQAAIRYLQYQLTARYRFPKLAQMNPGSLQDWPLEQQKPLFSVLGDVEAAIGVRLSEDCLMIPVKSVSGIQFPTVVSFENCMLCPRDGCRNRRANYDPDSAREYEAG